MKIEDYFKYYIQGSDHYLIPKDVFKELFNEMVNWREEAKELNQKYLNAVADYETTMFEKEQLNSLVNSCQEQLQQENTQLKENNMSMQEEMARTWEKADLYKEVIEEVRDRITIKLGRYINEKDYVIDDVALDELLQILDKGESNE